MLKLKQYSVEETDVNKNPESWKFSFLSSSLLIYATELVCEYLLWLSGGWLITWFNLDIFSFDCCSVCLYSFCKWQLCSECPNGKRRMQLLTARADTLLEHSQGAAPRAVIFQRKRMPHAGRQKADKQCAHRIMVKRMQVNGQPLQWVRKPLAQHPLR